MSVHIAAITFPPDEQVGAVAITDSNKRAVWLLWQAGGDPIPMSDETAAVIAERNLTQPVDLVGAETTNMIGSVGEIEEFETLEDALTASDHILARAQRGREPRTDIPPEIARQVRDLKYALAELRRAIERDIDRFAQVTGRLEAALTRPVQLPDRYAASQPPDQEAVATDGYDAVRELMREESDLSVRGLEDLELNRSIIGKLRAAGIRDVEALTSRSPSSLRAIPGVGEASAAAIVDALKVYGLFLAAEKDSKRTKSGSKGPTSARTSRQDSGSTRGTGVVRWFDSEKGYGFIAPEDGSHDLFVHYSMIDASGFRTLEAEDRVTYRVERGNKGLEAHDVRLL